MVLFYHGLFWSVPQNLRTGWAKYTAIIVRPGWLGVQLFFVLSGFLITGILLSTRGREDYYRRFYFRRVVRILPAFALLIVLLAATTSVRPSSLICSSLFLANVSQLIGVPNPYGPLWSLAVEEHFYLCWPAATRILGRDRAILWTSIAVFTAQPLIRYLSFRFGATDGLYSYTWFNLDGLALGAACAVLVRGYSRKRIRVLCYAAMAAGILAAVVGIPFGIATRTRALGAAFQVTPAYLVFAGLVVLCAGAEIRTTGVAFRIFRFFGNISYGLYLYHLLFFSIFDRLVTRPTVVSTDLFVFGRFVCVASVAIIFSYVSRNTLEEYFLQLKDRVPKGPIAAEA